MPLSSLSPLSGVALAPQSGSDIERLGYTIPEVCRIVPCSRATVYRLINQNKLELLKIGGRSIIPARSLRNLFSEAA